MNSVPDDTNSGIINYYQIGERTLENYIFLLLLEQKIKRHFYTSLRTKQGLGYIASAAIFTYGCVDYIGIYLQGDKKQPNEINKLIEEGMSTFYDAINEMEQSDFDKTLESQKATYQKLSPSFESKFNFMWEQVEKQTYNFDINLFILEYLDTNITLPKYKSFFKTHFKESAGKFSFQYYTQTAPFDKEDIKISNFAENLQSESVVIHSDKDLQGVNKFNCYYTL